MLVDIWQMSELRDSVFVLFESRVLHFSVQIQTPLARSHNLQRVRVPISGTLVGETHFRFAQEIQL